MTVEDNKFVECYQSEGHESKVIREIQGDELVVVCMVTCGQFYDNITYAQPQMFNIISQWYILFQTMYCKGLQSVARHRKVAWGRSLKHQPPPTAYSQTMQTYATEGKQFKSSGDLSLRVISWKWLAPLYTDITHCCTQQLVFSCAGNCHSICDHAL